MKVTIEKPENEKQEIVYPCLMESLMEGVTEEGAIYMFLNKWTCIKLCNGEASIWTNKDIRLHQPLPKGTKVIITQ